MITDKLLLDLKHLFILARNTPITFTKILLEKWSAYKVCYCLNRLYLEAGGVGWFNFL